MSTTHIYSHTPCAHPLSIMLTTGDTPTPFAVAIRDGHAAMAACLVAPPGTVLHTLRV